MHQRQDASTMMECVSEVDQLFEANKRKNNTGKMAIMFLSSANLKRPSLPMNVNLEGFVISPSKGPGVLFDCPSFEQNVMDVCKRGYYQLRRISRIRCWT